MKSTKQKEETTKSSSKKKAARSTTSLKKSSNLSKVQHTNATRAKVDLHKKPADAQDRGYSSLDKVAFPVAADKLHSGGFKYEAVVLQQQQHHQPVIPIRVGYGGPRSTYPCPERVERGQDEAVVLQQQHQPIVPVRVGYGGPGCTYPSPKRVERGQDEAVVLQQQQHQLIVPVRAGYKEPGCTYQCPEQVERGQDEAVVLCSTKIKLQLFPLDERVQKAVEKDGHNPHLELTLSVRKKISSVLRHLNNKWGDSTAASGDPKLFPFDIQLENLAAYRCWTLKDISVTAGDVHKAIGCPAIFRLRYGWFSNQEKDIPPSDVLPEACNVQETLTLIKEASEELKAVTAVEQPTIPEACNTQETSTLVKETSEELKEVIAAELPTTTAMEQLPPAYPSNTEEQGPGSGVSHIPASWFDSLSNISFGALMSEESLLGKCSMLFPKSNDGERASLPSQLVADSMDAFLTNHLKIAQESEEYRSGLQPSQTVADSLDAFFLNHLKNFQEPNSNKEELHPSQLASDTFDASVAKYLGNAQASRTVALPSSILDAEETCQSFAFKKPQSSDNELLGHGRRFFSALSAQDFELKLHCTTKDTEAINNEQGSVDDHRPEPEAPSSREIFNEESSMGFSKINWTDSMGPFDLSLSSQQKINGDSISLSEFIR